MLGNPVLLYVEEHKLNYIACSLKYNKPIVMCLNPDLNKPSFDLTFNFEFQIFKNSTVLIQLP